MTEYSKVIMALAMLVLATLPNYLFADDDPIIISRIIQKQETCELDNGQITIIIEGNTVGLQYSIDGGLTFFSSNHFENLDSKDYLIVISNGNTCSETYTAQIADAGFPELTLFSDCVTGLNRSVINPIVVGGSTPYQYEWKGPNGFAAVSESLAEAEPGNYYITITDNLGCSFSDSIVIQQCCSLNLICNLQDETYNCTSSIPELNPLLTDPSTSDLTKNDELAAMGISVEAGACGPINVQIIDTPNNPTDCAYDILEVMREYIISDAHNSIVCSQFFSVTNYIKASIIKEAENKSVSCDFDTEAEFQTWLTNFGGLDFQACSDPVSVSTIPAIPVLDPSCDAENKVTFLVEDGCGNSVESTASYYVLDEVSPVLACPEKLIIPVNELDANNTVQSWLASSTATDNCASTLAISNDYSSDLSDLCEIQNPITVVFSVNDNCNNSVSCESSVEIDHVKPGLSCPQDLVITCGEGDLQNLLLEWTAEVNATDNDDNLVTNDLNTELDAVVCSESQIVVFNTVNKCGTTAECSAQILISDEQAPEITCPIELSIDVFASDNANTISEWLEAATATDCNSVSLTNDYDTDLASIICSETIPITFLAEDYCGLTSSCAATISIINNATIEITCPEEITLVCTDPKLDAVIVEHIDQITITAQNEFEVFEDFDQSLIDIECETPTTIEVGQYVIDLCGNEAECRTAINIIPDPAIYIPNVFSPDGDGLEDRFTAYTNTSVEKIVSMTIFNKWGSKIFDKDDFLPNDSMEGWDGSYRMQMEQTEVFTYYIIFKDTMGVEIEKVGTVQVLRK